MLWVKSFHIVFVASWFAGLFYLPRIFVNLAMVPAGSVAEHERLLLMAKKLLRFTTILAVPAVALGLWLWLGYGIGRGPGNAWMHAKLVVVALAIGYHHSCGRMLALFEAHPRGAARRGVLHDGGAAVDRSGRPDHRGRGRHRTGQPAIR